MSEDRDIKLFELLKIEVAHTLRKKHSGCQQNISEWKGQEIRLFQEHLEEKVQGRVSEKWFYIHLKSGEKTLPRIDILNMLSRYCDYEDWIEFRQKNTKKIIGRRLYAYILPALLIIPLLWFAFVGRPYNYKVTVLDAVTLLEIPAEKLQVTWLKNGESPLAISSDEDGAFEIESHENEIALVIRSQYYFSDTIRRILPSKIMTETIVMRPNDFALMIHLFSKSKVNEWQGRREKLHEIFAHNASIIQVDENGMGMEMYNKDEFIDKLSFPHSTLKNIDVLETRLYRDKIAFLRFKTE